MGWTETLKYAIGAGGIYLDDEKDHVKLGVPHFNFSN